jgi:hypothetical protein
VAGFSNVAGLHRDHGAFGIDNRVGHRHTREQTRQLVTTICDSFHDSEFGRLGPTGIEKPAKKGLTHATAANDLKSNHAETLVNRSVVVRVENPCAHFPDECSESNHPDVADSRNAHQAAAWVKRRFRVQYGGSIFGETRCKTNAQRWAEELFNVVIHRTEDPIEFTFSQCVNG